MWRTRTCAGSDAAASFQNLVLSMLQSFRHESERPAHEARHFGGARRVGGQLFKRAGRGVQLTEAARACLPKLREGFESLAAAVEMIHLRADETDLQITAPPVFTARWLMPRLADFAKREPKIDVRVVSSSKMVDAGALDSASITFNLDLRSETSGVEIHLGAGDYPGHRADKLFGVSTIAVASPELVKGSPPIRELADLANHTLLHDDAMDLVAHGHAWEKWLELAGVADKVDGTRGPHFSSNILSLEAASQKLGVALALRPLVDADLASGRLVAPFTVELKPQSAYYLVCPEVIAERPAVVAFRKWLLGQANKRPSENPGRTTVSRVK